MEKLADQETNYFKVMWKHKTLIIVVAVLVGIVAFVASYLIPTTYDALSTLSVSKVNREATEDFKYDNFYAIQASELLGNTVVSWFKTPDFVSEVYEQAGVEPTEDLNKLAKSFKAKQNSSHTVEVRVSNLDKDTAQKLIDGMIVVIENRVGAIELTSADEPSFGVQSSLPLVFEKKYSPYLVGGIGLVCGLLLGIGIAFIAFYLKK